MTTIYAAHWVQPASTPPIRDGAVAVEGAVIVGVGPEKNIVAQYPGATLRQFGEALIIPGLVNTHTHLELTAMRGYLENEERDFFAWLRKLTISRTQLMTSDDLYVSAAWGACEAVRAGVTAVGDACDSGEASMSALRDVGLRGIVFQESFGPDPRLVAENFGKLKEKIAKLRELETPLVAVGVSPHAPYTVCRPQLESIADFATGQRLPLMMHAAESAAERLLLLEGSGLFAEGFATRGIPFSPIGTSTIQYLKQVSILDTKPLLAHCVTVDDADIETLAESQTKVAHCPKSNAKLGHGYAPFAKLLRRGICVGLGSDSVASNNTCDILEEARFASLFARANNRGQDTGETFGARDMFHTATTGGARCLGLEDQVGDLRAGLQADLTVLSLLGTYQLPIYDPLAAAIFSSSGRDVVATVIAGVEVYRDGRITTADEHRLKERIGEIGAKLQKAE